MINKLYLLIELLMYLFYDKFIIKLKDSDDIN